MANCPYGVIYHQVQPGDTLWAIINKYGTTIEEIRALNPGIDPNNILAGSVLRVCPYILGSFTDEQYNMPRPQQPEAVESEPPDDVTRWYSRGN